MHALGIQIGPDAGLLTFDSAGSGTAKYIYLGSSGIVSDSANTVTFDITNKVNLALEASASFTANGTGAISIVDAGATFTIGAFTLTLNGTNNASSIGQEFGGTGGNVIKSGTGTWTLGGNNTYTGTTTVSQGTLSVSNIVVGGNPAASNLGNSTSSVVLGNATSSGTLSYTGSNAPFTRGFTVNPGGGEFDTTTSGQIVTIATGGVATSGIFTIGGAGGTTVNSVISGLGGLAKSDAGTLVLGGNNNFSGPVMVSAGTLTVNSGASLASSAASLVVSSGTLNLNNAAQTIASLAGTGGTINFGGTLTDNQAINSAFAGGLAGAGNLVKSGPGTLQLTGSDSYTGTTTINAGTLQFGKQTALYNNTPANWTGAKIAVNSGATAAFNVGGSGEFTASDLDAIRTSGGFNNGSFIGFDTTNASGGVFPYDSDIANPNGNVLGIVKLGSGTLTLGGNNTYSGDTNVLAGTLKLGSANAVNINSLHVADGALFDQNGFGLSVPSSGFTAQGNNTFTAPLSGTGGFTAGSGTQVLVAANTYEGPTIITPGSTVKLGAPGALPTGTPVTLSPNATLDLNGQTATLGKLEGTGGTIALNLGASLTIDQSVSSTFSGTINGDGGLTKSGTGLLILTGINTFSGATAITGGQLKLNGSAANSAFTVSGGTLSGSGTVGALTLASGGTLSPGNSPGTLNAGNTTWGSGGSFQFEINQADGGIAGTNWDLLAVTGGLAINSTPASRFTISVISLNADNFAGQATAFNASQDYSFTLATTSTGVSPFAADKFLISTTGFANSFSGSWSVALSGSDLNLVYSASAIPEPSAYAAFAGAALLGFAVWRRRRARTQAARH